MGDKAAAAEAKTRGNKALESNDFEAAIAAYSEVSAWSPRGCSSEEASQGISDSFKDPSLEIGFKNVQKLSLAAFPEHPSQSPAHLPALPVRGLTRSSGQDCLY